MDYIEMGLGLLAAAMVLSVITVSLGLSKQYHEKQLESQIVSKEIQEQRNNLFYNNTHVYQQDVVAMVLRYKGDREVIARLSNGTTYKWSKTEKATDYKVSDISVILPKDVLYDADVIYGPNMYEVIGYQFVEHQAGCGR